MFLDTAGLLCLHHVPEPFHGEAVRLYDAAPRRLTHNYVLAEYVALAQVRRLPRLSVLGFLTDLLDDPEVMTIWADDSLYREALALLQARLDKTYSLCDAVSFLVMRRHGITAALTTDRHFTQEGFVKLLG